MHIKKLGFYVSLLGSAIFGNPVVAQDFPNKPIRRVVGFLPGGGIDQLASVLAQGV